MADQVIVGSAECSIARITNTIRENEAAWSGIKSGWQGFAMALNIPQDKRGDLIELENSKPNTFLCIFETILTSWANSSKPAPTLERLCDEFRKENFNLVANILEEKVLANVVKARTESTETYRELRSTSNNVTTQLLGSNQGWDPANVVERLQSNKNAMAILNKNVSELARKLEFKDDQIMEFEYKLASGEKKPIELVHRVLSDWQSKYGREATLEKLIIFLQNLGVTDASKILNSQPSVKHTHIDTHKKCTLPFTIKAVKYVVKFAFGAIVVYLLYSFTIQESTNNGTNSSTVSQKSVTPEITNVDTELVSTTGSTIEIISNITASSFTDYETQILTSNARWIHLTILITRMSDWELDSVLSKAASIRSLYISGSIHILQLINILDQALQITSLRISNHQNELCKTAEDEANASQISEIETRLLKVNSLVFTEFTACTSFYQNFENILESKNLESVAIVNALYTSTNIIYIRHMLTTSSKSLKFLELDGELSTTEPFYSNETDLLKVNTLKLNVKNALVLADITQQVSFLDNLCFSMSNLETFESKTGISYSDILNVLQCPELKYLNAKVRFGSNEPFYNINALIASSQLVSIQLVFEFLGECPNIIQIQELGIRDIKNTLSRKITSLNCPIELDHSGSNEVLFIEEGGRLVQF